MLFAHPAQPARRVRLAYCMNLHAADDLAGTRAGIERITVPLARRFEAAELAQGFGVGVYLPAHVALALAAGGEDSADVLSLRDFLHAEHLDPFTFNAFPYGGFHREGLKENVFRPTWRAPERMAYTLAGARLAAVLLGDVDEARHVSVSTHTGSFAEWVRTEDERNEIAEAFALCAVHLAQVEADTGRRVVLALEPEPRSLAGDTSELPPLFERIWFRAREAIGGGDAEARHAAEELARRHVGSCLDTCHAAVEFEDPEEALAQAIHGGAALGKLQFSSALRLEDPRHSARERDELLALAEPVYLHQVTGRRGDELLRVRDLPELASALETDARWLDCDEWRCHFHVPVDLDDVGEAGRPRLGTTRAHADRLLDALLARPAAWTTDELHVEIETYTWDVLPAPARGDGDLVDGLEREYRHVIGRLEAAGWHALRRSERP